MVNPSGALPPGRTWKAEHVGAEPIALGEVIEKNERISVSWPLLAALGKMLQEREELRIATAGLKQKQKGIERRFSVLEKPAASGSETLGNQVEKNFRLPED